MSHTPAQKAAQTKAMRKALGCVAVWTLEDSKFRKADVGVMIGHRSDLKPCEVQCPYCEGPMQEAMGVAPKRIVRVVRRTKLRVLVLAHPIPDTHRTVACYACKVSFTVPKQCDFVAEGK